MGFIGGGFLHGSIREADHKMTGEDISYIYPDYDTMLQGRFEDIVMQSAREAGLVDYGCDELGTGLPVITSFKYNSTDEANDVKFFYEPSSNETFGGGYGDFGQTLWIHMRGRILNWVNPKFLILEKVMSVCNIHHHYTFDGTPISLQVYSLKLAWKLMDLFSWQHSMLDSDTTRHRDYIMHILAFSMKHWARMRDDNVSSTPSKPATLCLTSLQHMMNQTYSSLLWVQK